MARKSNTRKGHGEGTTRQRADGSWEFRYTLGSNAGTGKQIQKSVYAKTEEEIIKKSNEIKYKIANGIYEEPNKMKLCVWLEEIWQKEYMGGIKPSTIQKYKDDIRLHIIPALGNVPLQKLNTHTIQKFYNSLRNEKGLSAKTVKNIHGVLHSALKRATIIGYINNNPADNIELPRIQKQEMHPLKDEKFKAFLEAIKGNRYEDIFFVDVFTGLRRGEILGLTWKDIDFEKQGINELRLLRAVQIQ